MTALDETRKRLDLALAGSADERVAVTMLARGSALGEGVVSRVDFVGELTSEVTHDVVRYARQLLGRELLPYDPSYQPSSSQALIDDLAQAPELARVNALVLNDDVALDDASESAAETAVVAMIHRLDGTTEPVVVYRVKGHGIATRRATGVRALIPRDGVYERADSEILYYESRFDALVIGDSVMVTAPSILQRRLGSPRRAQQLAKDTFVRVTSSLDIEGAEELLAAVSSDPAMIAKMIAVHRILEAEPQYRDFLTMERILTFLDHNPDLGIATSGQGGARQLVFQPSPRTRYKIIKLIADDYLRSDLSNRQYEAGSKHRVDGAA